MAKRILVFGGTRLFGRYLVARLIAEGHAVTLATRGLTKDPFGDAVERVQVDRWDEAQMRAAFRRNRSYDLVYDQLCYTPADAVLATSLFSGAAGRFVMASTIEVYRAVADQLEGPIPETAIGLDDEVVNASFPWRDPAHAEPLYGDGKRAAEAHFHQHGAMPFVSVRIGHVLGGREDFTGRTGDYVSRARAGRPLYFSNACGQSSFLRPAVIADFLHWVGRQTFVGPVNAASDGPLSALELHQRACDLIGTRAAAIWMSGASAPSVLSPFDFPRPFRMCTGRARRLGYSFDHTGDWLDSVLSDHLGSSVGDVRA